MSFQSWLLSINFLIVAALYSYHSITSRGDVRICPGLYKIKRKEDKIGAYFYYTLYYYVEDYFGLICIYRKAGHTQINPDWGFKEGFIEYKFNSVEDAERYYYENN